MARPFWTLLLGLLLAFGCLVGKTQAEEEEDECDGECVENAVCNDGDCECKTGFHGDGTKHCATENTCLCTADGDPHQITFDEQLISFQGACKYILSATKTYDPTDDCTFNIEVKNEYRNDYTKVTWVRFIDVEVMGKTVRLDKNRTVLLNKEITSAPFTVGNSTHYLKVIDNGKNVIAETKCGLKVLFDGIGNAVILVKRSIAKTKGLTGICGDCNGNKDDFRTSSGESVKDVKDSEERANRVASSYQVHDDSDKPYSICQSFSEKVKCETSYGKEIEANFCNLLVKPDGPFAAVFKKAGMKAEEFRDACRIDICANENRSRELLEEFACQSLEDAAEMLALKTNKTFLWRTEEICPLRCSKPNTVYKSRTSSCQRNCAERDPRNCDMPDTEMCACVEGFLLSGDECVPEAECGCKWENEYKQSGEFWVNGACTAGYSCVHIKDGASEIRNKSLPGCDPNAACMVKDGRRDCYCRKGFVGNGTVCTREPENVCGSVVCHPKATCMDEQRGICKCRRGYKGNGINTCEGKCTCTASGDPHYRTYDGKLVHFMGTCKYTLTRSIQRGDECGFNVEVNNEHRGVQRVSWTRKVTVQIFGRNITLLKGREVWVDGEKRKCPIENLSKDLTIKRVGRFVSVKSDTCTFRLVWDGRHYVRLSVSKDYENLMVGICGNCNGNQGDDMVGLDGVDYSKEKNKMAGYARYGRTFTVEGTGEEKCTPSKSFGCSKANERSAEKYCEMIRNRDGPFKQCIESRGNASVQFHENCVIDVCTARNHPSIVKKVICRTLDGFASSCNLAGFHSKWRDSDKGKFCSIQCKNNEVYYKKMKPCPVTCSNPNAARYCRLPSVSGCGCAPNHLLKGNVCVKKRECGCLVMTRWGPRTINEGQYRQGKKCIWDKRRNKFRAVPYFKRCRGFWWKRRLCRMKWNRRHQNYMYRKNRRYNRRNRLFQQKRKRRRRWWKLIRYKWRRMKRNKSWKRRQMKWKSRQRRRMMRWKIYRRQRSRMNRRRRYGRRWRVRNRYRRRWRVRNRYRRRWRMSGRNRRWRLRNRKRIQWKMGTRSRKWKVSNKNKRRRNRRKWIMTNRNRRWRSKRKQRSRSAAFSKASRRKSKYSWRTKVKNRRARKNIVISRLFNKNKLSKRNWRNRPWSIGLKKKFRNRKNFGKSQRSRKYRSYGVKNRYTKKFRNRKNVVGKFQRSRKYRSYGVKNRYTKKFRNRKNVVGKFQRSRKYRSYGVKNRYTKKFRNRKNVVGKFQRSRKYRSYGVKNRYTKKFRNRKNFGKSQRSRKYRSYGVKNRYTKKFRNRKNVVGKFQRSRKYRSYGVKNRYTKNFRNRKNVVGKFQRSRKYRSYGVKNRYTKKFRNRKNVVGKFQRSRKYRSYGVKNRYTKKFRNRKNFGKSQRSRKYRSYGVKNRYTKKFRNRKNFGKSQRSRKYRSAVVNGGSQNGKYSGNSGNKWQHSWSVSHSFSSYE